MDLSGFFSTRSRTAGRAASLAAAMACFIPLAGIFATAAAARCLPVAELHPPAPREPVYARALDGPLSARLFQVAEKPAPAGPVNRGAALPAGTVELTFLGHSSFVIRTHLNAAAVTDYNGYIRAPFVPDIVTMNRAHGSHFTDDIEPGVKHALRGWQQDGKIPLHDVSVRDLRVTNVPTNIREGVDDIAGLAGNSIFVFESAGLCIAHLGHLHHRLRPGHARRVGAIDIMLAPVDGQYTLSHETLSQVIDDLKPEVVIPMHYGFGGALEQFLAMMQKKKFVIQTAETDKARFSKATLPAKRTVLVLKNRYY